MDAVGRQSEAASEVVPELPVPPKRNQKGKVVRLGAEIYDALRRRRKRGESWSKLLERLCYSEAYWILPSEGKVFETEKDARGFAVVRAVQNGKAKAEKPIKVRVDE